MKLAANVCLNSKDSPDWTLKPRGNHVITPDQNFAATTVSKLRPAPTIPDIYTCSYKGILMLFLGCYTVYRVQMFIFSQLLK